MAQIEWPYPEIQAVFFAKSKAHEDPTGSLPDRLDLYEHVQTRQECASCLLPSLLGKVPKKPSAKTKAKTGKLVTKPLFMKTWGAIRDLAVFHCAFCSLRCSFTSHRFEPC